MSSLFRTLAANEENKFERPAVPAPKMTGYKIAIFFSFLLSLAALAGAGLLKNSLDSERTQRELLEASQTQLRQKADTFEKSSEDYRSQFQKIQEQIKTYTAEKGELQKQLEAGRGQIEELKRNITAIQNEKAELEKKAAQIAEEESPEAAASGTEPAVLNAEDAKPAAQASPQQAPKPPQVLTVNRKFNFAVVNIGLQQKIKIGDVLEILRKGKPVARLQVEKLYESFCAASITNEPKDAPIQEGDLVRPAV